MTLTITVRLPGRVCTIADEASAAPCTGPATGPGESVQRMLLAVLPVFEPAALLVAEAAGMGLPARIVCATVLRSVRHLLTA